MWKRYNANLHTRAQFLYTRCDLENDDFDKKININFVFDTTQSSVAVQIRSNALQYIITYRQ